MMQCNTAIKICWQVDRLCLKDRSGVLAEQNPGTSCPSSGSSVLREVLSSGCQDMLRGSNCSLASERAGKGHERRCYAFSLFDHDLLSAIL